MVKTDVVYLLKIIYALAKAVKITPDALVEEMANGKDLEDYEAEVELAEIKLQEKLIASSK